MRDRISTEGAQSSKDLTITTGPDDIHGLKHHCQCSQEELGKKGQTSPMLLTVPL